MRYILADIETTGLKSTDKICELAWVEVDNDFNTVGSGYSLINPEIPIGYAARAVNGISDDMVMDAPTIEQYMIAESLPLYGEDVVLVAHNCVTGDHEVRTRGGWLRFDQLKDGQEVAQWNPMNSSISFTKCHVVRKQYKGEMLEWDSQYHKGVYTPEHRIYFKGKQGDEQDWRVASAKVVAAKGPNSTVIPVSGIMEPDIVLNVTPDEARFLEMVRADGCIQRPKKHYKFRVRLKFKREAKIRRCLSILDTLNISYTVATYGEGVTEFTLHTGDTVEKLAALLGESSRKSYGSWVMNLSYAARCALLDEVRYWDGSVASNSDGPNRQVIVYSVSRESVHWLVEMAIMTGLTGRAVYDIPNITPFGRYDSVIHKAIIRPRSQIKTLYKPKSIQFDGTVYCVAVPTGAFMVRRQGVTWVTGNCAFDFRFLKPYMHKDSQTLCTLKVARVVYPDADNHKQATLAAMLGIQVEREKAHSADGDLDVLLQLLKCLCRDADCGIDQLLHIQNTPRNVTKISFGKHKGAKLVDLPKDYVHWLLNKCDNLSSDLRAALLALQ